jgi:RsiW-degrading membrane proteinase PrsW (M82 family)
MYIESLFICIAVPLAVSLFLLKGSARRFCLFLLSGIGICLLSAYVNSFLMMMTDMDIDEAAIYITPISEEALKLLPLIFYFFVYKPSRKRILAAAVTVGVGFALFENCFYLISGNADSLADILVRALAVGVMHIACTTADGYGLCLIQRYSHLAAIGAIGIFAFTVNYHAVYNLLVTAAGISRLAGYAMPLLTVILLLILLRREKFRADADS